MIFIIESNLRCLRHMPASNRKIMESFKENFGCFDDYCLNIFMLFPIFILASKKWSKDSKHSAIYEFYKFSEFIWKISFVYYIAYIITLNFCVLAFFEVLWMSLKILEKIWLPNNKNILISFMHSWLFFCYVKQLVVPISRFSKMLFWLFVDFLFLQAKK